MLSIYMKFFIRLKHKKRLAEIFVIPRKMSFEFCGHHSKFTLGSVTIYIAEHSIDAAF